MTRHTNTPAAQNLPPKVACCNLILNTVENTENDQLLRVIEHQEIKNMLSRQVGF